MTLRAVRTGRGIPTRRRRPRAHLFTVVAAYLFMLAGSPIGHAGYLWVHIATAHQGGSEPLAMDDGRHETGQPATAAGRELAQDQRYEPQQQGFRPQDLSYEEKRHDHDKQHQNREHHEHGVSAAQHGTAETAATLPASSAAHEHGGVAHTHHGEPPKDLAITSDELSKYFLAPLISPDSPTVRDGLTTPVAPSAPEPASMPLETPPPRTLA
ncbi:MAG: hypothetical protein KY464_10655 [Gemmatimonadetes bacterium]|nr:hypothetical protein [Gemmatimonadota bacterium]